MTKSFKKTPITGITHSESERNYKRLRSSQERMRVREALAHGEYELLEGELVPWDEWSTGRDGKRYFNPEEFPKLMRK